MRYHIVVMGAGGTGSALLPVLSRYVASKQKKGTLDIEISVIDGDVVEEKNLQRQVFQKEDIGLNKAVIFSEALEDVFGIPVKGYNHYIDTADQLVEIIGDRATPIIVSCVDNKAARLVMNEVFYSDKYEDCFFVDAGNEFTDGQCVFACKEHGVVVSPSWLFYYPNAGEAEEKARSQMTCSELNAAAPQHIAVNQMSAQNIFMGIVSIIEERPMRGISVFDIVKGIILHDEPEKYGFSVAKAVREFLDGKSEEEKLSLVRREHFLNFLATDNSEIVRDAAVIKIEEIREESRDDNI